MHPIAAALAVAAFLSSASPAWPGGSNYGIDPGTRPRPEGKISEWPVPTPIPRPAPTATSTWP
jgi:hypothetical protein